MPPSSQRPFVFAIVQVSGGLLSVNYYVLRLAAKADCKRITENIKANSFIREFK